MLDINGTEFREMVLRVIRQVMEEEKQEKRRLYIVFENSFDVRYDSFLHILTDRDEVTAVIPDEWSTVQISRIQADCPFCKIVSRTASANLHAEGSLTVYPVTSRSFIAKAALCISDTFEARWFAKCMEAGASVHILLSGLQRFTGKEPEAYVQRVLSYYRMLLQYDVSIGAWPCASFPTVSDSRKKNAIQTACRPDMIETKNRLITASDLDAYRDGQSIAVASDTIVTAYAQELAAKRKIQFIKNLT